MTITESSARAAASTQGRVPVFRPLLNGEEFDITISEAGFVLSENQHEVAEIRCSSPTLTKTDGILGSAITFFYGSAPRTELFSGYVVSLSEEQGGLGR